MDPEKDQPITNAPSSLESHLLAYPADESRLRNIGIEGENFRKKPKNSEKWQQN